MWISFGRLCSSEDFRQREREKAGGLRLELPRKHHCVVGSNVAGDMSNRRAGKNRFEIRMSFRTNAQQQARESRYWEILRIAARPRVYANCEKLSDCVAFFNSSGRAAARH